MGKETHGKIGLGNCSSRIKLIKEEKNYYNKNHAKESQTIKENKPTI